MTCNDCDDIAMRAKVMSKIYGTDCLDCCDHLDRIERLEAKIEELETQRNLIAAADESARDKYIDDLYKLSRAIERITELGVLKSKRIEQLEAVVDAAKKLKEDMLMRSDIGTHDGDYSVRAGNIVWYVFCKSLAAVEDKDDA